MNKYGAVFAVVVLGFAVLAVPAVYDIAVEDIRQRYVNESSTSSATVAEGRSYWLAVVEYAPPLILSVVGIFMFIAGIMYAFRER